MTMLWQKKWHKVMATALLGAVVIGGAAFLGGCGSDTKTASASSSSQQQVLKVGTNPTYMPFEFMKEGGAQNYQGFDIDLANEIGKRLNMKVEIKSIPFDGLIPAIQTGEINMIASGMVITPEREQKINFIPYYNSGLGILVAKNINDVKTIADLKGKRVAVQMGTTGSVAAHKIEGVGKISEYDHNSDALLELQKGGADAVLTAIPVAKYYLKTTPDSNAKLVAEPISKQTMGLGFSKDNKDLFDKVQKVMEDIKKDGTYDKLMQKWGIN